MALTHAFLVKRVDQGSGDAASAAVIARWWRRSGATFVDVRAYRGAQSADRYIYFDFPVPAERSTADRDAFAATLATEATEAGCLDDPLTVDRLECVLDVPGASRGERPALHYVVETDVVDGWQDEMQRWYDNEHMPGLAAVPGCVRARRFINHDRGPRSFACYDLMRDGVTESPPWLAVRASAWSTRVRPQFRNTKRTMFSELALPEPA